MYDNSKYILFRIDSDVLHKCLKIENKNSSTHTQVYLNAHLPTSINLVSVLLIMYLPISAVGYYVCGSSVQSNILQSLPDGAARITAEILITLHMVFAYIIWMNPLSQHMEKSLNISHSESPSSKTYS